MTRQITLDTETTGLSPTTGHRIIEIACVELVDRVMTKKHFHEYLNPQRPVDEGAFRVHGLSNNFLKDKPLFQAVVEPFLDFIAGAELIIHNAAFDVGFLEAELKRINWPHPLSHYVTVFDTLTYARAKHKGARNNLDALCKRYLIDNTHRNFHGALLDAEILASVYLAMTGGQTSFFTDASQGTEEATAPITRERKHTSTTPVVYATEEELAAHLAFMKEIGV